MELLIKVALSVCVFFVFGFVVVKISEKKQKQRLDTAFAGRENLTAEQFYQRFFAGQGIPYDVVEGLINIFTEEINADFSRLYAEDDFSKNLNFIWDFDSMADVEIILAIEKKFSIKISDEEAAKTISFRDLVQLVHSKTSQVK